MKLTLTSTEVHQCFTDKNGVEYRRRAYKNIIRWEIMHWGCFRAIEDAELIEMLEASVPKARGVDNDA